MVSKKHRKESFDSLMKRFKKSCEKDDIINVYKKQEFYQKPSAVRKRAKDIALKREQKRQEDQKVKRWIPPM